MNSSVVGCGAEEKNALLACVRTWRLVEMEERSMISELEKEDCLFVVAQ
jgi:hypothetical protein